MSYWQERVQKQQEELLMRTAKQTEAQIRKYYRQTLKKILGQFETVYQKVISQQNEGKEITPADLYQLDKYWKMQKQLEKELTALGDKEINILTKKFEQSYIVFYQTTALGTDKAFSTIDKKVVDQVINQIWCADGKSWSQRVWNSQSKLKDKLNNSLISCVLAGENPSKLKRELVRDFNVAFNRADCLVRTELAHIQTQASAERYKDYGIEKYELLIDADACSKCQALKGKQFYLAQMQVGVNAPPLHPNDRCCLIPIVEK